MQIQITFSALSVSWQVLPHLDGRLKKIKYEICNKDMQQTKNLVALYEWIVSWLIYFTQITKYGYCWLVVNHICHILMDAYMYILALCVCWQIYTKLHAKSYSACWQIIFKMWR